MTLQERIAAAADHFSPWAKETILDIQGKALRYGGMTERQTAFVEKLVAEAETKAQGKPAAGTVDLKRINAMFDIAAKSLKKPFVNFLVDGIEFKLSTAPANGQNPGSLYVKQAGAYQGKIDREGTFRAGRDANPGILAALKAFAADPAKAALAYGQATGNCCFCARELTDARSVEVGYGPVCADNYGLPWGE